ncbi:MAG: hypothetical protein HQK87_02020 [Nitrospinae bacterium]|nr:hypothetical protein [Nitrospinota bacterium]
MDTNVLPAPANLATRPPKFTAVGGLSLNLSYARSESLAMEAQKQTADGRTLSLKQEMARSYEANLSVDVSFLSRIEGAAEKMANIDPQVFASWQKEAGDLFSFSDKEFNEFVDATNTMFDEVEKAMGMGPTGLDSIAGFMTGQVKGFLDDVKQNRDYMEANPLGEGEEMGLGVPALMEGRLADMPDALTDYLEKMKGQMDEQMKAFGQEKAQPLLLKMRSMFQELLDRLAANREDHPEKSPDRHEKAPKREDAASALSLNLSAYREERSSISALVSYAAQIPTGDKQAPDTPLDVAA